MYHKSRVFKTLGEPYNRSMDIQITQTELDALTCQAPVPTKCKHCNTIYNVDKNKVLKVFKKKITQPDTLDLAFCSRICRSLSTGTKATFSCSQCSKTFLRNTASKYRYNNHFCSHQCSGRHSAANKTTGYNRSQYESYLEQELSAKGVTVITNGRMHGYELDLYLPAYKIAIEINGIFHYKPIYGQDKLDKTQFTDRMKLELCNNLGIDLIVFDISNFKAFKYSKHLCDTFIDNLKLP